MKLKLSNFQSHNNTSIDLGPFTVVVGHSSSGKTAIFRAVKALLFNEFSKSFVKKGSKKGTIDLEIDGTEYSAIREAKGTTSYNINGEVFKAVGKSQLPQLLEAGFRPINAGSKAYLPQMASQFDSPFIIDYSDAEVSKILSELSQTGKIKQAKVQILKDISKTSERVNIRSQDRQKLADDLLKLGDVADFRNKRDNLLKSQDYLKSLQDKLERLQVIRQELDSIKIVDIPDLPRDPSKLVDLFKIVSTGIQDIELPSYEYIKTLITKLDRIKKLNSSRSELKLGDTGYLEKECEEIKTQIPQICPECGQNL